MNNPVVNIAVSGFSFVYSEGLSKIIEDNPTYKVVEIIQSNDELTRSLSRKTFDLLIASQDFFDHIITNYALLPMNIPVLLVSVSALDTDVTDWNKKGIKNIILENALRDEIYYAIGSTLNSKKYYCQEILERIIDKTSPKAAADNAKLLTSSEMEIVKLIARGLTTKEIATKKNVSFHTVNTHRKNIFRKTGVANSSELLMVAIKAGWIDNIEYYI